MVWCRRRCGGGAVDHRARAPVDDRDSPLWPRSPRGDHREGPVRDPLCGVRPAVRHRARDRVCRNGRGAGGPRRAETVAAHRDRGVEARDRSAVPARRIADLGAHRTRGKLRGAAGARAADHAPRCFTSFTTQFPRETIMMMFTPALFALLAAASPPDSLLPADSLLVELRKGGYTIMWRHTATDRTVREPMDYKSTPRFQQRNLTDRGIADAKIVGVIFKARNIPIGDVIASPMFRTRETAEYAFGRVTETPVLRVVDPNPEQKRLIATAPAAGANRVLVTHHFVIERNVPGVKPGMVDEGEAAVVRRVSDDSVQLVGIFKMADWQRLGAEAAAAASASTPASAAPSSSTAPLVIPPLLQAPERAAIVEYFRVFNSGDDSRMRQFHEKSVVPNPDRTMEQRIEVYQRLKGTLGALSIVSAATGDDGRIEVKTTSGAGAPATVIFTVEPQAPHRLKAISFQMGGGGHP